MKKAFVTGSTRGIGRAIGIKLLSEGYFVYFNYANSVLSAVELEMTLNDLGFKDKYDVLKLDLSCVDNIPRFINLDCLVVNTAITNYDKNISVEDWNKVITTNLTVPYFLVKNQTYAQGASVIFIGALLGQVPHGRSIAYSVSKAGLHMLSKCLVKEYKHVTFNTIAVGFADTDWHSNKSAKHLKRIVDKIAAGRLGRVDEIADLCYHLTTNKYINGAVVDINGGYNYA